MLVPALQANRIEAVPAVWTSAGVAWNAFDAVVIRSCWDYHRRFAEFLAWLDDLSHRGVPVWNAPDILRWNAHKSYLQALADQGVATIPTVRLPRGSAATLDALLAARQWSTFVIKPCVSASGYETYALRAPLDAASRAVVEHVTALGEVLVQPFADEVPRDGEYSFVFIDGCYSHAALKRASRSDFRVQEEHGGTLSRITPGADLIAQAQAAIAAVRSPLLYARVDGIIRNDHFLLMELELVEPNLFLGLSEAGAPALAAAIARRL